MVASIQKAGSPTYNFGQFSQKLYTNEKRGAHISSAPSWIRQYLYLEANWTKQFLMMNFFQILYWSLPHLWLLFCICFYFTGDFVCMFVIDNSIKCFGVSVHYSVSLFRLLITFTGLSLLCVEQLCSKITFFISISMWDLNWVSCFSLDFEAFHKYATKSNQCTYSQWRRKEITF